MANYCEKKLFNRKTNLSQISVSLHHEALEA